MTEKPKKERRFLKALGRVGEILLQEVLIKVGSSLIKRIGGKKQVPSILFLFLSISLYGQFPININKQRLGFQTTADGLVWRGSLSDTASIQPVSNQNAWLIIDTVNLKIYSFDFTSNVWGLVGGGSAAFTQPIDSLFFKTSVSPNNVDTAKMRWDSELGTVVLGMYDAVPNEIGFKNFWLVKNQTGSTITKGSLVYANGTVGASGRITIAKFIANGTIDAKLLLGITAHDLSNGEDGYVISFGKIRQVNTDTFLAGAILYPSPTTAGVWTDVEPVAPNIDMPIGFCINSSSNNGTISIRVASGYALHELHDVAITSPSANASLYYKSGLWRDTTPTLLVSDTAAMLTNYATKAYADTSGRFYARQDFTNVSSSTLTWTQSDTLVVGGVNVVQVYRNGQILLPTQYTIPTNASVVIGSTAYKVGENYTVIFPRGGGAGSGGSGSLTSISGGTGIIVNPNPITTTGTVSADTSFLFTQSDTLSLNLTSRFALKLNATDTASLSNRIDAKGTGTVTSVASGFGLLGGTITTTGTLRLDTTTIYARLQDSINVAIGGDTIKILKQEYQPALSSVLTWTITPKFPIQLKAYILVFRNGQLLNNDQYNLTDTNKITIVSTSFKVGANYTVATVSGIGSVGSAQAGNPVYPEAGIALSTGSTWASSIPNNSSNWNTAYNDKVNSLAVTGTTTKTITLTQQDGGTVSGNFSDNGSVTSVDMTVPTGLAISGQPITTSGTLALSYASGYAIPTDIKQNEWNTAYNDKINNAVFTGTDTKTLTLTQLDGGTLTPTFNDLQGVTGVTGGTGLTGGTITMTGTLAVDFGVVAPLANPTFTGTVGGITKSMVGLGNVDNTSDANKPISSATQTALNLKFNTADTTSLNLTSRFAAKQNTLTNPVTGTGTTNTLPLFTGASTLGNSVIQESSGNIGIGVAPTSNLELAKGKFITLNSSGSPTQDSSGIMLYEVGTKTATDINFGAKIMYNGDSDNFEIKMKNFNGTTLFNPPVSISIPRTTGVVNIGTSLTVTGNITEGGNNVLTNLDTVSLSNRIDAKLSPSDTVSLSSRIDGKVSLTGDQTISGIKTFGNQVNMSGQITISGSVSGSNRLLGKNTSNNGVGDITLGTGLSLASNILTASGTDTTFLSDRINLKYNSSGGTISGAVTLSTTTATPTSLLGKDGSNVVGTVTTVAQTGLFGRGSVTNAVTDANGNITVAHGFNFTPIMAFANLPASTTNIVNVKEVDGTNITFIVRDGATNNVLNAQTVTKIEFFAIK
jgi:hypothetical protein